VRIPLARWVAPFGDPGINDCSHLPRAFRSVPRPSSPLSAKASTRCPSFALHSATPNGKNHRETRCCSRNAVGRTMPRALDPGPTNGQATFSPGGTRSSAVEDTYRDPPRTRPLGPDDGKIPPRSHNSLIHICPSTTRHRHPHQGDKPAATSVFVPRIGFGALDTSAFRPSSARPVGAAKPRVSPVVEVNGIEPMTSCLQSRRSPS
jgi:hypothetical protein